MGGGNREQNAARTDYREDRAVVKTPTPYEQRRERFNKEVTDFAESGDYRNPTGAMRVFMNFADPAEQKRLSDLHANTRGQGVSAFGAGANPTLLALDKQHRDAQHEEATARNYQNTLSSVVGGAYEEAGELQSAADAKNLSLAGMSAGRLSQERQLRESRPRWWQTLMGTATRGAQAYAAADASN